MKTCSTSLRQNAYKAYQGHESLKKDKVVLEKFFFFNYFGLFKDLLILYFVKNY
jgi:hypothetical protein